MVFLWQRINPGLRLWGWMLLLAVLLFFALFPILFRSYPYRITLVLSILIYITLAESYDIVGGHMGYINLGHTVFFAIGAYAFGISLHNNVPLPLAFFIALLLPVIFAIIISIPIFRLKGMYFAIATFGLTTLLNLLAFNLSTINVTNPLSGKILQLGTGGSFGLMVSTGNVKREAYWAALALAVITVGINLWVARSKVGLALFSIREDEEVAAIFGVPVQRYKMLALALSATTPGLAGAVFLWNISYIEPFSVLGSEIVLIPVVMAMLGGSGMTIGPLVGAMFIMLVQEFIFTRIEHYHLAVYGLILASVGLFMPGGLARQIWFTRIIDWLGRIISSQRVSESTNQRIS